MKMFAFALALAVAAASVSPAFAATKAKHTAKVTKVAAKTTVSKDDGDAAVAKLNQAQLDKIKSGQ